MENIKISNFDDAVTHLSEVIANVASAFSPQDQDDISQACWLKVFTLIQARGEVDLILLINCIPRAARRESRVINSYGLTPYKSKYKPPTFQWEMPDNPADCQAEEELRDVELESTDGQERILYAINRLLGEGIKPTQEAIAKTLGTSILHIRWQLRKIRKRYHDDKDND